MKNGWKEAIDSNTGRTYYFNEETLEVSWSKPVNEDDVFEEPSSPSEDPWLEVTDSKTGKIYFYNTKTKETSWTKPEEEEEDSHSVTDTTTEKSEQVLENTEERLDSEKSKATRLTDTYVKDVIKVANDKAKITTSFGSSSKDEQKNMVEKLEQDKKKLNEDTLNLNQVLDEIKLDKELMEEKEKTKRLTEEYIRDSAQMARDKAAATSATSKNEEVSHDLKEKLQQDEWNVSEDKSKIAELTQEIVEKEKNRIESMGGKDDIDDDDDDDVSKTKTKTSQSKISSKKKSSSSSSKPIEMSKDGSSVSSLNNFEGTSSTTSTGMRSISFRGKSTKYASPTTQQQQYPTVPISSETSSTVTTTNILVYESVIEFKFLALASAIVIVFFLLLYRSIIRRRRPRGGMNTNQKKSKSSARKNTSTLQMSLLSGGNDLVEDEDSKLRHRHTKKVTSGKAASLVVEFIPQRKGLKKLKKTSLLKNEHVRAIVNAMPSHLQARDWKLMYSTELHGYSVHTLYSKARKMKGPSVIVVKDKDGHVFGGFASHTWRKNVSFFGTGECFLFSLLPKLKIFEWTGTNSQFLLAREECIGFGGGGSFGLWLDGDFETGNSNPCPTFSNPTLSGRTDFSVLNVEVWGMDPL